VQGKTEVKQGELQQLLTDVAADRVALIQRHEASARAVSHYDFNNTYQYVISREETYLGWLQNALSDFEVPLPGPAAMPPAPETPKKSKEAVVSAFRSILEEDARGLGAFVDRWRPRVATMTHARHRIMLDVMLGESLEHKRLFDQAASGFEDLLGRRTGGVARQGAVLSTRWME
jgi:hypothetical protein